MPPTSHIPLLKSALLLSFLVSHAVIADPVTESIENALKFGQKDAKYGQVKFNLRYRYENDATENPRKQVGNASTVRLRLGYLSPEFHGLQAYAEYEMNQDIGANTYNSLRNSRGGFEVIADPQEHELNQLWVSYKGIPDTEIKIGRQQIKLDNDRFIGNVGWRQMEQTFDSVLITNKSLPNTTIKAGYISQAQTILSTVDPMQTPFVNISYQLQDIGTVTGYGYWVDINSARGGPYNLNASNQTFGVSLTGKPKVTKDISGLYRLEYAYQKDYGDNPTQYETDYYHVMGGIKAFDFTAKIGFEQLDGAGLGTTFDTPLATGHAFNGWADQFLTTPADGLRDVYASLGTNIKGVKILGVYHEFTDDTGQIDYGNEWNFLVTKKFAKHYSVLAKYAYFDGNNGRFDSQNFWLEAGVSF
ncbi:MAG: alginate export family protein [Methylococcales bacterium]|nr:alginate export family protein [Methylococcales bacterium]MCK5925690.1 alginate export family protein [Methylococcales bacterium]